jgi:hypothetical protein
MSSDEPPPKQPRKRSPTGRDENKPSKAPDEGVPGPDNLPAKLPDDIREELQLAGVDPQNLPRIEEVLAVRYFSYRGSWPPPEIIRGYEKVLPGSGKMILDAVIARTNARAELEKQESIRSDGRMRRGQNFGFLIAAGSLVLAGILGIYGNGWVAAAIAIFGLCVGIGGPSVARVIADKIYLDVQKWRGQSPPNKRGQ